MISIILALLAFSSVKSEALIQAFPNTLGLNQINLINNGISADKIIAKKFTG
jgi:hypothetical protein